ncbi:unnamed protein product [Sphagnum jensenii]|uniref:Uncharacterized protein n=1 Tax=Sphagnum jensenii TaxID=128206 RepID=A0ABP1AW61_9BRYO
MSWKQGVGHQGVARKTSGRRAQDGRQTKLRRKSDESRTNVGRNSNESPTNVGRTKLNRRYYNGRWQHYTVAPRTLQLAAVARPAERCSSLL